MRVALAELEGLARDALRRAGHDTIAISTAEACAWLHACGYPGLPLLAEALKDTVQTLVFEKDAMGLDLKNVSCVFLAKAVTDHVHQHGRIFLRNVRHGLYLLPGSVEGNYGIGCPVDPAFAIGGERTKNPYAEKLAMAAQDGVDVNDVVWQSLLL